MSTYALTNQGLDLYHRGFRFEAHESFEAAWKVESGSRKAVLQALVQISAAAHKANEDNFRGVVKLLNKAQSRLEPELGQGACLGLDLVRLAGEVRRALDAAKARLEGINAPFKPPVLPEKAHETGVIYLHGFASSPLSTKARRMVPEFEAAGIHVEVPDLNEDDFQNLTVTRALARTRRCLKDRSLIIGSSLGGYIATCLAMEDTRIKALVLMAPAFDFAVRLENRYGAALLDEWRTQGVTLVEHYGYKKMCPIGYQLYEDATRHPARPPIRVPTYILQGAHDDVVPADMVTEVATQAGTGVTLECVEDDHTLVKHANRARDAALRLFRDYVA